MIEIIVDDKKFFVTNKTLQNNQNFIVTRILNGDYVINKNDDDFIEQISPTTFIIDGDKNIVEKILSDMRKKSYNNYDDEFTFFLNKSNDLIQKKISSNNIFSKTQCKIQSKKDCNLNPVYDAFTIDSDVSDGLLDSDKITQNQIVGKFLYGTNESLPLQSIDGFKTISPQSKTTKVKTNKSHLRTKSTKSNEPEPHSDIKQNIFRPRKIELDTFKTK